MRSVFGLKIVSILGALAPLPVAKKSIVRMAFLLWGLASLVAWADPAVDPHPLIWHVRSANADAYLFGSIHVLPPNIGWRSRQVSQAIADCDTFVFEVPEDSQAIAELKALIETYGYLPNGESLRAKLDARAQKDFDDVVKATGIPLEVIDHDRPWLAGLQLLFAQIAKEKFAADNGVDVVLMAQARHEHKEIRYLETIQQQFSLLAPDDKTLELEEFESGLKDLRDVDSEVQPLVDAWLGGDSIKLDELINGDLNDYPAARKVLLDDRNKRWMTEIKAMLSQKHTFFITVGAGHLIGPSGLPALLRSAGYHVEGP